MYIYILATYTRLAGMLKTFQNIHYSSDKWTIKVVLHTVAI